MFMATKTSKMKWLFVSLVICVLLIAAVFLLVPSNKKPKVDYLAEYNRITKPADFDPNDNAAPYFDKAFELMSDEPDDLQKLQRLWPGDMNDEQLQTTKLWVESNKQTLDCLNQGISKKYYWKPLKVDNNEPLMMIDLNDLSRLKQAVYLLCLDAKLKAHDGQIEPAMRGLADVYKMGTYLSGPRSLIEQLVGIGISALSVNSAFQILDHTNPSPALLEDFQNRITLLSSDQPFLTNFSAERLIFFDVLDRILNGYGQKYGLFVKKLFLSTVGRAFAEREKRRAVLVFEYIDNAKLKTPWQLHKEGNDVNRITEKMTKRTLYLRILIPSFDGVLKISYRVQVQTEGLITTIAILRYKADRGSYPQDLQMLLTVGYLSKLPIDPFSSSPLVYKITGDNFILYSFAQDFDDDGGKHDFKWAGEGDGDFVFWPVQYPEKGK